LPFHALGFGPTVVPSGSFTSPASWSCTQVRSRSLSATFATFGRHARVAACHCAIVALQSNRHVRVDAFRRSSREIVDGDPATRRTRRAISRTP
jgi:hypothetical protein